MQQQSTLDAFEPLPFFLSGVDTPADRLLFAHYMNRLSPKFTVETGMDTSFQTIILPFAGNNPKLMHELFCLTSQHVDFHSDYGRQLQRSYGNISATELIERSSYHLDQARFPNMKDLNNLTNEQQLSAALQLVLRLMTTLVMEADKSGAHRVHLEGLQKLMSYLHPCYRKEKAFLMEFIIYHSSAVRSMTYPIVGQPLLAPSSLQHIPDGDQFCDSLRLVGVADDSFSIMERITDLRDHLRPWLAHDRSGMDFTLYTQANDIRNAIQAWSPHWPEADARNNYGVDRLHQLMMMISLLHTICPLSCSNWIPNSRIAPLVNEAIEILQDIPADSSLQTILLRPIYHIGWSAFFDAQRVAIRQAVRRVRDYMEFRNADAALMVLEEVWRRLDRQDPGCWDVANVAYNVLGMDFLAT